MSQFRAGILYCWLPQYAFWYRRVGGLSTCSGCLGQVSWHRNMINKWGGLILIWHRSVVEGEEREEFWCWWTVKEEWTAAGVTASTQPSKKRNENTSWESLPRAQHDTKRDNQSGCVSLFLIKSFYTLSWTCQIGRFILRLITKNMISERPSPILAKLIIFFLPSDSHHPQ